MVKIIYLGEIVLAADSFDIVIDWITGSYQNFVSFKTLETGENYKVISLSFSDDDETIGIKITNDDGDFVVTPDFSQYNGMKELLRKKVNL